METHHPRTAPVSGRSRRLARTLVPVVAALVVVGLWGLRTGSRFAPDTVPGPAKRSVPARIDASTAAAASPLAEPTGNVEHASHETMELATGESAGSDGSAPTDDDRCRRQVVGDWGDEYQGHRRLTVRDDGTARMVVEPSGFAGKVFASKLTFEIEWTVTDGRIVMETVGGEPRAKTNLVINLYGTRAEYTLLHLDDKQLLLLDADGKTKYDWRRVADEQPKVLKGERGASAP
ncbi:MAG TPA: hypothetical protein VL475_00235 [Planctomycetaceae bacterium]|nr:hypothetical protein [Planctomycetaceae bacterium]